MARVKICGITNIKDALLAVDYGADALGFIFCPSPRKVMPEEVKGIVAELPPFVAKVGVFAGHTASEIEKVMSFCGLDLAQLHGGEPPDFCAHFYPKVIKSITLEKLPPISELKRYNVAAFLLDREKMAASPFLQGGGEDDYLLSLWQKAKEIKSLKLVILSGGLTPENVRQAIKVAQPYAVDVASGVEKSPGRKDPRKLRDFIEAAKRSVDEIA